MTEIGHQNPLNCAPRHEYSLVTSARSDARPIPL